MSRAKQHLASERPRFKTAPGRQEEIAEQFLQACNSGDLQGLIGLLSEDIVLRSDGGGKVLAALKPLYGSVKIARFLLAIKKKTPPDCVAQIVKINGQLGMVYYIGNQAHRVVTFDYTNQQIQGIFIVVNPDKLKSINSH